jgi:hypothetical protein
MDFGITVATAADSWKVVKRAEELGCIYAWFYDTQMLNEPGQPRRNCSKLLKPLPFLVLGWSSAIWQRLTMCLCSGHLRCIL